MTGQSERDLTGAYALDAVSAEERRAFEQYLLTDDDARAEATELGDTAVYLGMAVAPEQPPAAIKERLMALLDDAPQLPREADPEAETVAPVAPVTPLAPRSASVPGRVSRFTRRTVVTLSAAAAILAAVVVGGIVVRPALAPDPTAQAISQLRDASDMRTARASVQGGGTAEVIWSSAQGRAAVTVDGLPALPDSRVYELWFINGVGIPSRAGTFITDGSPKTVMLSGRMSQGDTIAITIEPKGGSNAPTTDPVALVQTA